MLTRHKHAVMLIRVKYSYLSKYGHGPESLLKSSQSFSWSRYSSLSWKPKVHYHVHKSPPLAPNLERMNLVHTLHPVTLRSTLISSHLRIGLPSGIFHLGFPIKILRTFLISPMRVTCSAHLIFRDFIITIFCEEYELSSSF
jgi:hypothetical protein